MQNNNNKWKSRNTENLLAGIESFAKPIAITTPTPPPPPTAIPRIEYTKMNETPNAMNRVLEMETKHFMCIINKIELLSCMYVCVCVPFPSEQQA